MKEAQLALPGVAADAAEWVWTEDMVEDVEPTSFVHATVMRAEVVHAMASATSTTGVVVDATLGGGGHSEHLLATLPDVRLVALDRDQHALSAARERLAPFGDRVTFVHSDFARVREVLEELGLSSVDAVCADLGVSSPQLDTAGRGMSFRREGPIDMRMDQSSGETALELIERLGDDDLADVLFQYGEERRSRRIARSIKRALEDGELLTTLDLRRAIVRAVGPVRVGGVDPATRTFQALRIAVNEEVEQLESLLGGLRDVIAPGGVAAILSFHSLEDRLAKRAFRATNDRGASLWEPLSKKPLVPTDDETTQNPRARSAKLRAARRVIPPGGGA
jgi:16S rRNA (cytosine1402-N4)-methyltransferase